MKMKVFFGLVKKKPMTKIVPLFSLLIIFSCTPQKVNQYVRSGKVQLRHGFWKEQYDSNDGKFEAKGRYDKGEKVGVWKTSFNGKKFQKDRVLKNGITKTTIFHPNGKVMEKGQSRIDISANERHWYYFGDWRYFDNKGKLLKIMKYADGTKVDSIIYSR